MIDITLSSNILTRIRLHMIKLEFDKIFWTIFFKIWIITLQKSEVRGGPCNPSYWEDGI